MELIAIIVGLGLALFGSRMAVKCRHEWERKQKRRTTDYPA